MGKHEYIRIKLMDYVRFLTIHIGMIFNNIKLTLNRQKKKTLVLVCLTRGKEMESEQMMVKFTHLVVGNKGILVRFAIKS